ncbi:MAG: Rho termination factor N-terminal domain-containing protein, partial [Bacillota bacterium]
MDISLLKEKSLMDLREIAKMAGIKSVTKYRKSELLDMLYELDRQARSGGMAQQQAEKPVETPVEAVEEPMEEPAVEEPAGEDEGNIPSYQQDVLERRHRRERPRDNDMAREPRNGDEKKIIEYVMGNDAVNELLNKGDCGDAMGILEVLPEGYGFLRSENYLPGNKDVYVSMAQ